MLSAGLQFQWQRGRRVGRDVVYFAANSPGVCFVEGPLVAAEDGLCPIEEIKAGDYVWAEEPETGERALKRVVRTFLKEKDELVHIQVGGETITCTTEHPFYVQSKGWVAAQDLKPNDKLELRDGEDAFVDAVRYEKLDKPIPVFNFEVEGFHTYYVGAGCVLVHNLCKNPDHGNSHSTTKPAKGYILKERGTNIIMKYGETTRGIHRYTQKFYRTNNVYRDIVKAGTKREMRAWQHKMIEGYVYISGELPPLNKSLY